MIEMLRIYLKSFLKNVTIEELPPGPSLTLKMVSFEILGSFIPVQK